MKKHFLIILLIAPMIMKSQEVGKKPSVFSIGVTFSPDYCYRNLQVSNDSMNFFKEWLDSLQEPKIGYTVGLTVSYDILKRLSIESGILFSNKGYKSIITDFSGAADPNDPLLMRLSSFTQVVSYFYFGIPVLAKFRMVSGKFTFAPAAGLLANIYLDSRLKSITKYNDGTQDKKEINAGDNGKDFTLSLQAGIGIDYNLSDKLSIGFEPVYKRDITKSNSADSFDQYLYGFGANVGLKYRW